MRRLIIIVLRASLVLFAGACGDDEPQTLRAAPAELRAITYHMYYGLAANLLPEDSSTGSLSDATPARSSTPPGSPIMVAASAAPPARS